VAEGKPPINALNEIPRGTLSWSCSREVEKRAGGDHRMKEGG